MERHVNAQLELEVTGDARMTLSVAVADHYERVSERLEVELDGRPVAVAELVDVHGTRLHDFSSGSGLLTVAYDAVVRVADPDSTNADPTHADPTHADPDHPHADPDPDPDPDPTQPDPLDEIRYLRPSRYSESDALLPTAREQFGDLAGLELVRAVRDWVHGRTAYTSGSSSPTDGARDTLLARQGVCRDFAHLTVGLLRALDVPARLVSVYAPGLSPMDFHAVTEALVDGEWVLIDSTGLAPRESMVRIATGRDAADTAFLTSTHGGVELKRMQVLATADRLPVEDPYAVVRLR